ncbi:MAG: hypothetical protein UH249_03315 [Acutalibacteraceae bacterium]|nr:hypothetical protein [Acutalibacteraceae bacterium]
MKNFKKIFSLIMAVILVMGIVIMPVSAKDDAEEEIVARMYIGYNERYMGLSGHSWIYVENLTDHSIVVGAYTVKKGKAVSLGTAGTTLADGRGLYYNVEAYRYRNIPITDYVHLSKDITQKQLDKLTKRVLNAGVWSYFINCTYFAASAWNSVGGGMPLVYALFPTLFHLQILIYPKHGNGFPMQVPALTEIYKQHGRGANATLVQTDPTYV